jgi:hypothetical protein
MVIKELLPSHGFENELKKSSTQKRTGLKFPYGEYCSLTIQSEWTKKESYLGRSGLRSHMLKTGSLAMELRISKEKLATGYCLKSHKWITTIRV